MCSAEDHRSQSPEIFIIVGSCLFLEIKLISLFILGKGLQSFFILMCRVTYTYSVCQNPSNTSLRLYSLDYRV